MRCLLIVMALLTAAPAVVQAQEICGDGVDNAPANSLVDEGCNPAAITGVCEQPLGCGVAGAVAPITGGLVHPRPADLSVTTPYGPGLHFQRTYHGRYVPRDGVFPGGLATYAQPMGQRWQHNYMSWVAPAGTNKVVVHMTNGLDVLFTLASTAGGFANYAAQAGHAETLRQNTSSLAWELQVGDSLVHEFAWDATAQLGRLAKIRQIGRTTGVSLTYSLGKVTKVTDEAGSRWLALTYDGAQSGLLTAVGLWSNPASPSQLSTVVLGYDGSKRLTSVGRGGETGITIESYVYDGVGDLTSAAVGSETDASWTYKTTSGVRRVARASSGNGTMAFAYAACNSGAGNYQYFQRTSTTQCTSDAACGAGSFCGGINDAGVGQCFAARQCVSYQQLNEPLPTTITASCAGCTDTLQYKWNTGAGNAKIELLGRQRADGRWTSYLYDTGSFRYPTKMVRHDVDWDALSEASDSTVTHNFYSTTCPGKLTETRLHSELRAGVCNRMDASACKQTILTYNTECRIATLRNKGYTYDDSGTVVSFDYLTTYGYDAQGRMIDVEGPRPDVVDGVTLTYWPDGGDPAFPASNGMLREIKRKNGGVFLTTVFDQYSPWGKPGRSIDANSSVACRSYNNDTGQLSVLRNIVDGPSTCTWAVGANDQRTTFGYHADGRPSAVVFPEGNCVYYGYDAEKRLTSIKRGDFNGTNCQAVGTEEATVLSYDADGNVATVQAKDGSGTVWSNAAFTYDANDRRRTVANPASVPFFQEFVYNDLGYLIEHRSEDVASTGAKTQVDYSPVGKITVLRRFLNLVTNEQIALTPGIFMNLPTRIMDAMAKPLDMVWDDLHRQVKQRVQGVTTLYVWDAQSNLVKQVKGHGTSGVKTTTYSYDALARVTSVDTAEPPCFGTGGAEIQYTYDSLPAETCPGNVCTRQNGRLARVKTQLSCHTRCGSGDCRFDRTTLFGYAAHGRIADAFIQDDGSPVQRISYAYDRNGNVKRTNYPAGASSGVEYAYGRLDGINSNDNHVIAISRGAPADPVEGTVPALILDQVKYYPFGPLKSYRQQNGMCTGSPCWFNRIVTTFARNQAYRVIGIHAKNENASPATDVFKIAYAEDVRGRYTKRDFLTGQDAFYKYDNLSRVLCQTWSLTAGCPGAADAGSFEAFTYNASGQRASFIRQQALFTNVYVPGTDQLDRIDKASGSIEYTYDALGNRVADDDLSIANDQRSFVYDARGNLVTTFGYYSPVSGDVNAYAANYAYDEQSRRIYKSFLDTDTGVQSQTYYYYDQFDRLIQAKHTPNIANSGTYSVFQWYWLNTIPFVYYQIDYPAVTESRRYLHADDQGRPQAAWSWPVGSVSASKVWQADAGTFGNDTVTIGLALFQPLRFPGQIYDRETEAVTLVTKFGNLITSVVRPGITDNRFRAYDSFTGTYLQIDPLATATWDSYSYTGNNPVMRVDPLGLEYSDTSCAVGVANASWEYTSGRCECNDGYIATGTDSNGDAVGCLPFWGTFNPFPMDPFSSSGSSATSGGGDGGPLGSGLLDGAAAEAARRNLNKSMDALRKSGVILNAEEYSDYVLCVNSAAPYFQALGGSPSSPEEICRGDVASPTTFKDGFNCAAAGGTSGAALIGTLATATGPIGWVIAAGVGGVIVTTGACMGI